MILCDDSHEQICYDGGWCPLCDAVEKIDSLESEIQGLEEQLEERDE